MGGTVYTPLSSTSGGNAFIAAYADDLGGLSASSQIAWKLEGTAPNRELVIEWKNMRNYNRAGVDVTFQVRLAETTNVFSVVYGTMTYSSTTSDVVQVGAKSSTTTGHFINRTTTTNWNATTAGGSNSATCSVLNTVTMPASGLTFTWTPPGPCAAPTAQPTALAFGTTTTSAIAGSFTAASPAPAKYLLVRSTSATAPTPANGTSYAAGSTALGTGTYVVQSSSAVSFNDTGLTAGTTYYYYVFSLNDSGCTASYLTTSPLTGSRTTVCATGTSVGSNTVTTTSANITWTGTGTYIVEYGASGFTPGTGATAGTGGTIASSAATSPFALGGLAPSTTYVVYVRQICAAGGYSANSSSHTFTTACAAITTFPSAQPFDTYLPTCWKEGDMGDLTAGPATISSSASDWTSDGFLNAGTTGAAKMNIDAATGSEWLISPFYTIPASGYRVKYSVGATNWGAATAVTNWEADDLVELLVSTSNTNWTVLKTYNSANVPSHLGQLDEVDLEAYSGQTVQFAFRAFEGIADGSADIDFFIDDFIVELIPVVPPSCATGHVPADLATDVVRNSTLTWTAAAGSPTSYDIYFGTAPNAPFVGNQPNTSYTPATMAANTTYYWKVVPRNNNGPATSCVERSFTTGTGVNYCTVSVVNTGDYTSAFSTTLANSNVSYTATSNPAGGYSDQTAQNFAVGQGEAFNFSHTYVGGGNGMKIWIDFGNDGNFDAGDEVFYLANSSATKTGSVTIPFATPQGTYRVRVRSQFSATANPPACGSASYGTTIDFTLHVVAPPSCVPPTALNGTAVTAHTATLAWTASNSNPSNGYDIYYSTTNTAPLAGTTPTVENHP